MRSLLSLVLVALCAACAGREINPDAATSQLAYPSQCPWSPAPWTSTQADRDCVLEPQRAFPRQDNRGTPLPAVNGQPLKDLPR
jgi:hypothetical protein